MRLKQRSAILASTAIAAVAAFAMPAAASAAKTVWVSTEAPSAPYNSCEHPGYDSIQEAINGSGSKIEVCDGTYREQLQIERPVTIFGNGARLEVPAVPQKSSTACDAASEAGDSLEDQDLISICTAGKVTINGLIVDAIWPGQPVGATESCAYNLYGILVGGGADLQLTESRVLGAAPTPINGCQYGVGVQVGMSYATPAQVGEAKLSQDIVEDYQKNGITVDGAGSQASIADVDVIGAGKTTAIAQNGIGVQLGAKASIAGATVSHNECENATCGPNPLTQYQAEGVYFYGSAAGSSVKSSTITENDTGVETFATAATEPTAPQVSVTGNTISKNRDEGVLVNQGWAKINDDSISNSNVGIEAIQIGEGPFAQAYGPRATASGDTITGMTEWAVAGDSDNTPGDKPGSISIKRSAISGNPGPTVAESVHTNNEAELPIITKKDT
jgi:Right handed beta helix region